MSNRRLNHVRQFVIGMGSLLDPFVFADQRAYIRPKNSGRTDDLIAMKGDFDVVGRTLCLCGKALNAEGDDEQPHRSASKK